MKSWKVFGVVVLLAAMAACWTLGKAPAAHASEAQEPANATPPQLAIQLAILDTDIGDDIDDAFALALVLRSPEIKLLGITTEYGDTELRARLVDRYLAAVGRTDIQLQRGGGGLGEGGISRRGCWRIVAMGSGTSMMSSGSRTRRRQHNAPRMKDVSSRQGDFRMSELSIAQHDAGQEVANEAKTPVTGMKSENISTVFHRE